MYKDCLVNVYICCAIQYKSFNQKEWNKVHKAKLSFEGPAILVTCNGSKDANYPLLFSIFYLGKLPYDRNLSIYEFKLCFKCVNIDMYMSNLTLDIPNYTCFYPRDWWLRNVWFGWLEYIMGFLIVIFSQIILG